MKSIGSLNQSGTEFEINLEVEKGSMKLNFEENHPRLFKTVFEITLEDETTGSIKLNFEENHPRLFENVFEITLAGLG